MLRDFEHQPPALILGLERIENRRQVALELHVDDRADDLRNASDFVFHGFLAERPLERLGAGDDLDQLLGDHRLARAV